MFFSLTKLAIGGIVAWCFFWLITPVDVVGHVAPGAMIYIVVCYIFLLLGALYGHRHLAPTAQGGEPDGPLWQEPLRLRLFLGSVTIGLFGMAMRLFDRLYLRGAQYGGNALEFRDSLANSDVSTVGAIASALYPFCLLPLLILLASGDGLKRRGLLILAIVVFCLPMAESLFQLSRSFLIMTMGLAFATIVITHYRGNPFNRKLLSIAIGGLVVIAFLSTAIFSARLEAGAGHLSDSVFDSVYADYLQPNNRAREAINSGSETEVIYYNAILPNGMYYMSGVYEVSVLWDRPDGQRFAYGQLLFLPFVRGLALVVDRDMMTGFDIQNYVYRDGVFQTFFGPLWVDFGWFGPLFMALFGFLFQRLAVAVRQGSIAWLPLYAFLSIVVFFMPVVNLLVSGFGMFCVIAFALFAFYARPARRKPEPQLVGVAT